MKIESKILKITALVIGSIALFVLFILFFGFVAQMLWNGLLPDIFGLPNISFLQACGLLLLAKLFFGFGTGNFNQKTKQGQKNAAEDQYKKEFARWLAEKKQEAEQP
jgi:hypothetical protein